MSESKSKMIDLGIEEANVFLLLLCDRKMLSLWQNISLLLPGALFGGIGKSQVDHWMGSGFFRSTGHGRRELGF